MQITKDIQYIGVNDHEIDLFEGQYAVPRGMAYNSYLIADEKLAVMDSVDARFGGTWLEAIDRAAGGRAPDYLIVQHMEPDHSGSILRFAAAYPDAVVVASSRAFTMMGRFFGTDFSDRRIVVGEGDTLSLGRHTLTFITAPMVHWPEVLMTYDGTDQVLFSADAFGKFGALDEEEDWAGEARRYYIGIVGKYGAPVQALLKKAAGLSIRAICPLHGPVLKENIGDYVALYDTWSRYAPEEEGIVIAYTSIYGHTKKGVLRLADRLSELGCPKVVIHDLARCDMAGAVADAFRYSKLVLATTTYNGEIFPFMREFLHHLTERNFSGRTIAFVENGSWAPAAVRIMREILVKCKDLTEAGAVTIHSALTEESAAQLDALATALCAAPAEQEPGEETPSAGGARRFLCKLCGYVYEGGELPEDYRCPLCGRGAAAFEEMK